MFPSARVWSRGGLAGEDTGPYRKARRHLLHHASEATFKFWGQVVAREAERQWMFIA